MLKILAVAGGLVVLAMLSAGPFDLIIGLAGMVVGLVAGFFGLLVGLVAGTLGLIAGLAGGLFGLVVGLAGGLGAIAGVGLLLLLPVIILGVLAVGVMKLFAAA